MITTADTSTQSPGNDLMTEADSHHGLLMLLKNPPDILCQTEDPGIIGKRIMFCQLRMRI